MASQGDLGINSIISDFDELTYYNSTQIVLWGLSKLNLIDVDSNLQSSLLLYGRMSRNNYLASVGSNECYNFKVRVSIDPK